VPATAKGGSSGVDMRVKPALVTARTVRVDRGRWPADSLIEVVEDAGSSPIAGGGACHESPACRPGAACRRLPWAVGGDPSPAALGRHRPGDHRAPAGRRSPPGGQAAVDHAITIGAPAEQVWPWLAQMGYQGRAGMYSYDVLERRFGARTIDRLNPDLEPLVGGERMPFAPGLARTVAVVDPPHALVLWQIVSGSRRPSALDGQKPPASASLGDEPLARAEGPGLRRRGREGPTCRGSLGPRVAALEQETGVRR
jgi:hypothetical protein